MNLVSLVIVNGVNVGTYFCIKVCIFLHSCKLPTSTPFTHFLRITHDKVILSRINNNFDPVPFPFILVRGVRARKSEIQTLENRYFYNVQLSFLYLLEVKSWKERVQQNMRNIKYWSEIMSVATFWFVHVRLFLWYYKLRFNSVFNFHRT